MRINMTFELTPEQVKKFNEWKKTHTVKYTGAIGVRYTFTFHGTSLGVVTKVIDEVTKEELDLSDYLDW